MIDSEIVVGTGLRITVAKDELAAKLAIVARGVSTRATVLVLGGIQLRAESGQLHFAATDMEVSLRATVDGVSRHAFETSRITQSYAAGWFQKHAKEGMPSEGQIQKFLSFALHKIREELRREVGNG